MMKLLVRGLGAAAVAAVMLVPRVTIAEEVSDDERRGEYDEDGGQRFGSVLVSGALMATANSPSGWALVRTYENKSDEAAHCVVEERVMSTLTIWGARVTPRPQVALTRTQVLDLKPHEKKSVGVYVSAELGKQITANRKIEAGIQANPGVMGGLDREYKEFAVEYLRPLAKGETAMKPDPELSTHPARMPGPPSIKGLDLDDDEIEPLPKPVAQKPEPAPKQAKSAKPIPAQMKMGGL